MAAHGVHRLRANQAARWLDSDTESEAERKGKGRGKGRSARQETQDPYPRPSSTPANSQRLTPAHPPRAAWEWLDTVDLNTEWRAFVPTFSKVPFALTAPLRRALRLPLQAIHTTAQRGTAEGTQETHRAWKLLQLVPRLLLHKEPGQRYSKDELQHRARLFDQGKWNLLYQQALHTERRRGPQRELSEE